MDAVHIDISVSKEIFSLSKEKYSKKLSKQLTSMKRSILIVGQTSKYSESQTNNIKQKDRRI